MRWIMYVAAYLGSAVSLWASDYVFIYDQPLEGVYSQSWHIDHLREVTEGTHEIYLRGEGKMGDFFGVLWLDCNEAKYSRWLVTGGFVSQERVPPEAIRKIRSRHC